MGFSVSAVFTVLALAVVISLTFFIAAVFPSISTFNVSVDKLGERGLQTVQSQLDITGVSDGETGIWWNTSYGFRKRIDIIAPKEGAGTNYQVPFVVASSPRVQTSYNFTLEGLACDFPHDIRFINKNHNKELGYWIEDFNVDPITVWVKIEDNLNEDQSIYVYYGADGVSTTSCGDSTFVFFDDFETDLSKWHIKEECGDAHVLRTSTQSTGGEYSVFIYTTTVNCRAQLNTTVSVTRNCVIEFDWAVQAGTSEYQVFATYVNEGGNGVGNLYAILSGPYHFQWYDGSFHILAATYSDTTQWHFIQQFYDFDTESYDIYINGFLEEAAATFWKDANSIGYLVFGSGAGADWGHQYVDTFRIRNWTSPEPMFLKAHSQETILLTVEIENTGGISVSANDCIILVNGTKYYAKANCSYIHPLNNEKLYTTTQTPSGEKRVKLIALTNVKYYYQHGGG